MTCIQMKITFTQLKYSTAKSQHTMIPLKGTFGTDNLLSLLLGLKNNHIRKVRKLSWHVWFLFLTYVQIWQKFDEYVLYKQV